MVALLDGQIVSDKGLIGFKVLEPFQDETIVPTGEYASSIVTFPKDSIVYGYPAKLDIKNASSLAIMDRREGLLVEQDSGHVVIPFDKLEEVETSFVDKIKGSETFEDIESGVEKIEKKLDSEKFLGFTYKQILFIGLVTIIVSKLVKN